MDAQNDFRAKLARRKAAKAALVCVDELSKLLKCTALPELVLQAVEKLQSDMEQAAKNQIACPNCEHKNLGGSKFCNKCGCKLAADLDIPAFLRVSPAPPAPTAVPIAPPPMPVAPPRPIPPVPPRPPAPHVPLAVTTSVAARGAGQPQNGATHTVILAPSSPQAPAAPHQIKSAAPGKKDDDEFS